MTEALRLRGRQARIALATIVFLFLGLATLYNVTNPLFESPDEIWHYFYAQELRQHWQLPLQSNTRGGIWGQQEAAQPPLYYVLGAAITFWIPVEPPEEWLRANEHASIGAPLSEENKNRFVHSAKEDFPYQGDFLAAHLIRFLSTLFGAGTVVMTYLIARTLWPEREWLAVGAAALNAFVPQFIYISAAVNNDVPVAFISSVTLFLAVRMVRHTKASVRDVIVLGTIAGLASLTKTAALPALALAVGATVWVAWTRRSVLLGVRNIVLVSLPFAVVTGWWFVRNIVLYQDWLPLRIFLDRASLDDQIPTAIEVFNDLAGLRYSFWALFGWFSIMVDRPLYLAFDGLVLLSLLGWVAAALFADRRKGFSVSLLVVATWAAVIGLALLRYRMIVQAFQGRLLFPAVSSIAIMIFFGLSSLLPAKRTSVIAITLALCMLTVAAAMPFRYLIPNYERPAPIAGVPDIASYRQSGATLGADVELAGFTLNNDILEPGQTLDLTLYWRPLRKMPQDYSVFVKLLDWKGRPIAQKDSFPGGGKNATSLWQPGEVSADTYHLRLPDDLAAPALLTVETGLYQKATLARLPVHLADGTPANSIVLGRVHVTTHRVVEPEASQPVVASFADQALLVVYTIDQEQVVAGGKLSGNLNWKSLAPFRRDYTVFVQLVGPVGVVAQHDAQPQDGAYPTSAWLEGDQISHQFEMEIPAMLASADYRLIAGLYDLATGQRLLVGSADYIELRKWKIPTIRQLGVVDD